MVKFNKNKEIEIVNFKKSKIIDIRQKAPKVFDMTTVCYVARPNYILQNKSSFL